jgi:hypothetical protein
MQHTLGHIAQAAITTYLIVITPMPTGKHTHVFQYSTPAQGSNRKAAVGLSPSVRCRRGWLRRRRLLRNPQCPAAVPSAGDLDGKLDMLRVACRKCDRAGQYSVAKMIERHGADAKLVDWKDTIAADCSRRANDRVALNDACGAYFPDLVPLFVARDS